MLKIKNTATVVCDEFAPNPDDHLVIVETPLAKGDLYNTSIDLDIKQIQPKKVSGYYVFPVKFICGETESNEPLINAEYRTTISILNLSEHKEKFRTKLAMNYPKADKMVVTPSTKHYMKHNQSIELDSKYIRASLTGIAEYESAKFIEGFLMIKTKSSKLQVAVAYSGTLPQ